MNRPPTRFTTEPPYKTEEEIKAENAKIEEARLKEAKAKEEEENRKREEQRKKEISIETKNEEKKFDDANYSPSHVEFTQDAAFDGGRRNITRYDLSSIISSHANYLSRENAKLTGWLHSKQTLKTDPQKVLFS